MTMRALVVHGELRSNPPGPLVTLDVDSKNLCEFGLQHSPSKFSTLAVFDGFLHLVLLRVGQFANNLEC